MSRMMCPYCGWTYDPSIDGTGYDLVPNHWHKAEDCPGQNQHPRNAESDKRPLWSEEQESKMFEAAVKRANDNESQLVEIANFFGEDARGHGSIAEMVKQKVYQLRADIGGGDTAIRQLEQEIEHLHSLIRRLVGNQDTRCSLDHHGYCQEHNFAPPCPVPEAQQITGVGVEYVARVP